MSVVTKKAIEDVLRAVYCPFGFSLIIAILVMFVYLFIKEKNVKVMINIWTHEFIASKGLRRIFLLFFYVTLILFWTILNRNIWDNPLSDICGGWGLYDRDGKLTTEAIENLALFMPFTILLFWNFRENILGEKIRLLSVMWESFRIVCLCSLSIELSQLMFRVGTFQFSDICYNTLGGMLGGIAYWIGYKVVKKT